MKLFAYIAIALPLAYHAAVFGSGSDIAPRLSMVLSLVMCLGVAFAPSDSSVKRDVLEPPRLLAVVYMLVFPIFGLFYLDTPWLGKWYDKIGSPVHVAENFAETIFLVTATAPLFYVGYRLGFRRRVAASRSWFRFRETNLRPHSAAVWLVALTAVGMAAAGLYLRSVGGAAYVFEDLPTRYIWRGRGNTIANHVGLFLMCAPVVYLLRAHYLRLSTLTKLFGVAMLLASAALLSLQGTRLKAVFPIMMVLLTGYYFNVSRRRPASPEARQSERAPARRPGDRVKRLTMAILATVAAVALFVTISTLRESGSNEVDGHIGFVSDLNRIDIATWMFHDHFDLGYDHLYGPPLVAHLSLPFYRIFGTERWMTTPEVMAERLFRIDYEYGASSTPGCPMAAELFVNFGHAGLLLFVFAGLWFGRFRAVLEARSFPFWSTLLYSVAVLLFVVQYSMHSGVSSGILFSVVLVTWILVTRYLTRPRASAIVPLRGTNLSTDPSRR